MRISTAMRTDAAIGNVQRLQEEHHEASVEASTGARVTAPSKDPIAAARAIRVDAAIQRTQVHRETIRDMTGDLDLAESALAAGSGIMARIREIVLQASSGSLPDEERKLMASEVVDLKSQLVSLANTKSAQGFVFGGTATDKAPFSSTGAFGGNDVARDVEIAQGSTVRANPSGAQAFTSAGGVDVFATLDTLQAALAAGDEDAAHAILGDVDTAHRQMVAERASVGMTLSRLETTDATHQEIETTLAETVHGLIDADLPAAYTRLLTLQQRIEQAIAVTRQILSMSSSQQ